MFVNGANSIEEGRSLVLARINEACGPLPLQKEGSVGQIEKHNKNNDRMTKISSFVIPLFPSRYVNTFTLQTQRHNHLLMPLCRKCEPVFRAHN